MGRFISQTSNFQSGVGSLYQIFILGTAGSGKSYLTAALGEWIEYNEMTVTRVNLDPAAEWLPYSPDVDVRDYIDARKVMVEKELGPNAALIVSIDLLATRIEEIKSEIVTQKSNYVIIDTPGQLELFAFRHSGPLIANLLAKGYKAASVFLIDSFFSTQVSNMLSALLLASSVQVRIRLPQLNVLSKSDLIPSTVIEALESWFEDVSQPPPELLRGGEDPNILSLAEGIARVLSETQMLTAPIPVSAKTGEGLDVLYANLQRLLAGGEDFLTEEPSGRL